MSCMDDGCSKACKRTRRTRSLDLDNDQCCYRRSTQCFRYVFLPIVYADIATGSKCSIGSDFNRHYYGDTENHIDDIGSSNTTLNCYSESCNSSGKSFFCPCNFLMNPTGVPGTLASPQAISNDPALEYTKTFINLRYLDCSYKP